MEYQATSKYIRTGTRKMRLVADLVRKMTPEKAQETLKHLNKRAAEPLAKVFQSVIANAKKKDVTIESLRIKSIEVMGGPVIKRFHAVSRGMAHGYKKRMTHVRVVLIDDAVRHNDQSNNGGKQYGSKN